MIKRKIGKIYRLQSLNRRSKHDFQKICFIGNFFPKSLKSSQVNYLHSQDNTSMLISIKFNSYDIAVLDSGQANSHSNQRNVKFNPNFSLFNIIYSYVPHKTAFYKLNLWRSPYFFFSEESFYRTLQGEHSCIFTIDFACFLSFCVIFIFFYFNMK